MNFDFGENLKALRKQKGFTQEQAAELLNISKQSVSRWENNITYPDVMFLPTLASFYGVTVDQLLGADYETIEAVIDEYQMSRQESHRQGNVSDAYELSYRFYASYPNNKSVINNMMVDSYLMGVRSENGRNYFELSISVGERFMKLTDDIEEQCRCIKSIAVCNKLLGNHKKAKEWMDKLPSMWSSVDFAALDVLDGEDKADSIRCSMEILLHLVQKMISAYAAEGKLSGQEQIKVLKKIPKILEAVFEDGDYGFYHLFLSRAYTELAKLDREYVCLAKEHAQLYDTLSAGTHTSVLFKGYPINPDEFTRADNKTQSEIVADELAE